MPKNSCLHITTYKFKMQLNLGIFITFWARIKIRTLNFLIWELNSCGSKKLHLPFSLASLYNLPFISIFSLYMLCYILKLENEDCQFELNIIWFIYFIFGRQFDFYIILIHDFVVLFDCLFHLLVLHDWWLK